MARDDGSQRGEDCVEVIRWRGAARIEFGRPRDRGRRDPIGSGRC